MAAIFQGGRPQAGADAEERLRATPPAESERVDGLVIALLVMIALLMAGSVSALWRIVPLVPTELGRSARPQHPPASPAAVPAASPGGGQFEDLFMHDLILGVLDLQRGTRRALWLTADQARGLQTLLPRIHEKMARGDYSPSDLDAAIRDQLRPDQKREIRRLRVANRYMPPPRGSEVSKRLEAVLKAAAR